jgi:Lhr-like helicase
MAEIGTAPATSAAPPRDRSDAPRSGRTWRSASSTWRHRQRSTLIFANSRRLAERLTARLNEIWDERHQLETRRSTPTNRVTDKSATVGASPRSGQAARTPAQVMAQAGGSGRRAGRLRPSPPRIGEQGVAAEIEEDLKSGRLPCVVATSSLNSASTWAPSIW